jgi:hypothetical protein
MTKRKSSSVAWFLVTLTIALMLFIFAYLHGAPAWLQLVIFLGWWGWFYFLMKRRFTL